MQTLLTQKMKKMRMDWKVTDVDSSMSEISESESDEFEGKLTIKKPAANKHVVLENNCVAFMFDEIRYELNGVDIDRSRNAGITSTLKNYVSLTASRNGMLKNAGWDIVNFSNGEEGHFNFCVPLSMLLGFCEDYRCVVINARHELIVIRSRNDNNCLRGDAEIQPEIELLKVQWRMPHIALNEINKLAMLRTLESGRFLSMSFRSWDLQEFPLLQSTTKHSWTVKATTQLEKPRYVIFALQTGRKNNIPGSITKFDECKLTNVKLYLNSEFYPYDDLNLDFGKRRYAILYDIESVKTATVDVRLEFDCMEDIPANTTAYCLIIHDRVVEYSPLTNVVHRIT
ncbi:hypothetical protein DMN91_001596 [Ooceraea biroi]|uniref:Double jelly roll-like domain-containing protein n=1 Tax=Ooceraea biroi TaxID=2015173 RepID=A0A3L8DY99_OOCBI|nr:hypothetical protein DMN91_001596 [Ooceraea biroi]